MWERLLVLCLSKYSNASHVTTEASTYKLFGLRIEDMHHPIKWVTTCRLPAGYHICVHHQGHVLQGTVTNYVPCLACLPICRFAPIMYIFHQQNFWNTSEWFNILPAVVGPRSSRNQCNKELKTPTSRLILGQCFLRFVQCTTSHCSPIHSTTKGT